jgi:hypothetical protein
MQKGEKEFNTIILLKSIKIKIIKIIIKVKGKGKTGRDFNS